MGNTIRGVMNESELSKESESLNKKMDDSTTYSADGKTMPDRQTADNYAAYNNNIAAEDEATFGGGLSSAPKTTVDKAQTYTRADYYADMGRKASGLGMADRAERYQARSDDVRDKEWQRGRLEKSDQRAEESHTMGMEKGQIDLDRAKAEDESRKRVDGFYQAVNSAHEEAGKNGGTLTWDKIEEMARGAQLKPSEIITAASALTGMDEAGTKYTLGMRVAQFDKAYHSGGLDKAAELYNSNQLFDNGTDMEVKRGKSGAVTLMNGKTELFAGTESEAAVFLRNHLTDPISAVKFNMEVLQNRAKLRESESKVRENDAQASNALASAGKHRAETGVIKQGGGQKPDDVRQNTNAAVKQVLLATGLAKQDQTGNLFMQAIDGKTPGNAEQEIARISAQAEELVRQGVPPYKAAEQVIQGRSSKTPAPNPNRKPLSHFAN